MFSLVAAVSLALASIASATPLGARQASTCSGLGDGAYNTAYNFQLAAFNLTGTNPEAAGAPLTVAFHQYTGSATGSYFATLTTTASYSTSLMNVPNLNIVNGALLPTASGIISTDLSISTGQLVEFEVSPDQNDQLPSPFEGYCVVDIDQYYPILAVNGDTQGFYICESDTPLDSGVPYDVVYLPTSDTSVNDHIYDYSSCYNVQLNVVFNN